MTNQWGKEDRGAQRKPGKLINLPPCYYPLIHQQEDLCNACSRGWNGCHHRYPCSPPKVCFLFFCLFYSYYIYYRVELLLEKSGISVALPPHSHPLAGSARSAPFLFFSFFSFLSLDKHCSHLGVVFFVLFSFAWQALAPGLEASHSFFFFFHSLDEHRPHLGGVFFFFSLLLNEG